MGFELYNWQSRFAKEGLTYGLRSELLELLKPLVRLRPPFHFSEPAEISVQTEPEEPKRIKDIVDWEIVLGTDEVHDVLGVIKNDPQWRSALVDLLPSLTSLLLEALELMRTLQGADAQSDQSYLNQPSIAEHPQNQKFRDWTALIDLTRDAFLATVPTSARRAQAEAERWLGYPYPLFRRLAFFAATNTELFSPGVSLQWLLVDGNWWLWSVETEREAIRLIVKLANKLNSKEEGLLFSAILQGPPKEMFRADVEEDRLERIQDREIWLRLAKYQSASGRELSGDAAVAFARIAKAFPDWVLADDESDEFPFWMGDAEDWYKRQNSPKELPALEDWLLIEREEPSDDDWRDRCKDDFSTTSLALAHLAEKGRWPIQRWRTALQVWSDQSLVLQSWGQIRHLFDHADEGTIQSLARPLSSWLQAVAKVFTDDDLQFHQLVRRIIASQTQETFDGGTDPIFKAINHPVGQAVDAVFRWWYRQGLEDGQGLKDEPKGIYNVVCNRQIVSFRYGRIILAANLIALFRVDRGWTERYVVQNLDWNVSADEAAAAWSGFLWAPRLYVPLLASIKLQFLETAKHYDALGQFAQQYANLLTFVALESPEPFTKKELALATIQLPPDGLARCARSLVQGLDSAGEKRVEYWKNRIRPYIEEIWPKSADVATRPIANSFARLCMNANDAFPDAVKLLKPWLSAATQSDVTIHEFRKTDLAKRFPENSLVFLDTILSERSFLLVEDLKSTLTTIREVRPNLETDPRYERLNRYARQLADSACVRPSGLVDSVPLLGI